MQPLKYEQFKQSSEVMADKRKLQGMASSFGFLLFVTCSMWSLNIEPIIFFPKGEIDRCLKKVGEGVDTFNDIWEKVVILFVQNVKSPGCLL